MRLRPNELQVWQQRRLKQERADMASICATPAEWMARLRKHDAQLISCITQPVTSIKNKQVVQSRNISDVCYRCVNNGSVFHSPVFIKPSEGRVLIMGCLPVSCTLNVHPKCIVSFSKMKNRKLEAVDAAEDITFQLAALQMVTASFLHTWVLLSFGF